MKHLILANMKLKIKLLKNKIKEEKYIINHAHKMLKRLKKEKAF